MASEHVSLREFIERILDERERRDLERLHTLEIRLEKLNELRQEVITDRGNYITRVQYEAEVGALEKKVNQAEGALNVARFLGAGGIVALLVELARSVGYIK